MAKQRDYRAERARRNALAKAQGFTSHDQKTRLIRQAKSQTNSKGKKYSPNTVVQRARKIAVDKATAKKYSRGSLDNYIRHAKNYGSSANFPDKLPAGISKRDAVEAHRATFGAKSIAPTGMKAIGPAKSMHMAHTRFWYVNVLGMYTHKEYDDKYGVS